MASPPIVIEPRATRGMTILDDNLEVILVCDATVQEKHNAKARITQYPREDRSPASDHIQPEQLMLDADIIVSPTSLIPGEARRGRDRDAYEVLRALQTQGRTVTLVTSLRVYTGMALGSCIATRTSQTGQVLEAATSWQQIEVANTQATTIPASVIAAVARSSGKGKDKTKDQVSQEEAEIDQGSLAYDVFYGGGE